ncbi:MAG TPA: hypothetical protein VEN81_06635 [Planctomycetota bacterium]|nr:hypothetical protein [Planctomycetota bacterium]
MILPVMLALIAAGATADESTLVTATNASIPARDVTVVSEGGELVVKYTDSAGRAQTVKASEVVELTVATQKGPMPRPALEDLELTLTTGDTLTGRAGAKSPDAVQLLSKVYGDPVVRFNQIRVILLPANRDFLPKQLPARAETADILFTKTGDRSTGTLQSISSAGVVFHSEKRDQDVTYGLADVAGIWLIEAEKPPAEPDRPFAAVLTADGSNLRGDIQSLSEGVLTFKDLYGQTHKVASNLVSGIYMKNGRVVYLSDIQPTTVSEDANFIRGAARCPATLNFPGSGTGAPGGPSFSWGAPSTARDWACAPTPPSRIP